MKARKFLIVALALSMATVACSQNNAKLPDGTSAKDLLPSKAQIDSVSYLQRATRPIPISSSSSRSILNS